MSPKLECHQKLNVINNEMSQNLKMSSKSKSMRSTLITLVLFLWIGLDWSGLRLWIILSRECSPVVFPPPLSVAGSEPPSLALVKISYIKKVTELFKFTGNFSFQAGLKSAKNPSLHYQSHAALEVQYGKPINITPFELYGISQLSKIMYFSKCLCLEL